MEKIIVNVAWCDKNFGGSLGSNVPGAVVFTAPTFEALQKEAQWLLVEKEFCLLLATLQKLVLFNFTIISIVILKITKIPILVNTQKFLLCHL